MARIAVVHVPYFSHINAATRLTAVLAREGHEVISWAPEACRPRIEAAGAQLVVHEPEMPSVDGFMAFVAAAAATTLEETKELVEQLFAHDVDVILHDSQVPWAKVAGEYLGVPRIVSHPMFPIVSSHHIQSDLDWDKPAPHPEEAKEDFEASWLAIAKRWGVELGDVGSVIHTAWTSETTLGFTTREILGDDFDPGDNWELIGPLLEPPPPRAPRRERPLVYVCFGTSFNARSDHFQAVVEALADEPVDVLVSTGAGRITADNLEPLPANVALRDFVPAREILARADAHITHGGNNSVHECLLAGVPMLCIPQGFDQFPLAGRVQVLGAGLQVSEDPAEIRDGMRWLLNDPSPTARARELGDHLAHYDGEGRVAAVFDRVLAENAAVAT